MNPITTMPEVPEELVTVSTKKFRIFIITLGSITAVFITSVVVLFYFQFKKIANLERASGISVESIKIPEQVIAQQNLADTKIAQKVSIESRKSVIGHITAVTLHTITIATYLPDVQKMQVADPLKPMSIPMVEKVITAEIASTTKFTNKKLTAFMVGDTVSITSSTSVLLSDSFVAESVTSFSLPQLSKQQKNLPRK